MADDAPTPTTASTPNLRDDNSLDTLDALDAAHIADLLAALERIPRDELPDDARAALADAIHAGRVDNLYQPLGCDHWNISWADRPAWVDPRQNVLSWILECRARQALRPGGSR